jgi:hypothetical protein
MDQAERNLFENLPEAFIDHNQDVRFNPVADCRDRRNSLACVSGFEETFIDFNDDGAYSYNDDVDLDGNPTGEPPAVYNGLLCPPAGDGVWCSRDLVNVRKDVVLFLSAEPEWSMILVNQSGNVVSGTTEGPIFDVYVSDVFNNRPPAGSTITVSTTGDCVIESETQFTVPIKTSYGAFGFELETSGDGGGGRVQITLTPEGDSTPFTKSFNCASTPPPEPDPEPEEGDDELSLGD